LLFGDFCKITKQQWHLKAELASAKWLLASCCFLWYS
jgi:hypothetical protein